MRLFKKQKPTGRQPISQTGKPKPAFSYYAGDNPSKQDSIRARQASEQRVTFFERLRLIPTIIAIAVIVLSVAFSTTLSSDAALDFAGNQSPYRSVQDYENGVAQVLNSSLFNKSKLTLNARSTSDAILKKFPELDIVTVSLPVIGRRSTVTMHVRQPSLILTTSTNAFVLDRAGKVVAEAAQLQSSAKESLLTVQDQSGLAVVLGGQALPSDAVAFIANVQAQLMAKQLAITSVTLPKTPNEVDFHIKDLNYYIKTDTSGDARQQIGDFLAAKDSGVKAAEYMDVRVEEKVFYK